jgi:RNA ligase (TIGR02306 family)
MPSPLIVEVCEIEKIENLENAQRLQMATIKGWQALVGKDEFTVGEPVIFVPTDSVVPQEMIDTLKLEYLREHNGRLRTIKLRGYISQGLVLKLDTLRLMKVYHTVQIGEDVGERLGIKKYEVAQKAIAGPKKEYIRDYWTKYLAKEITLRRFVAKSVGIIRTRMRKPKLTNVDFKCYTDINNVKHYPSIFEEGEQVLISEKIHGTNFRAGKCPVKPTFLNKLLRKSGFEFCYGSHHVQKTVLSGKGFYGDDVYGKIAAKYNLKDVIPDGYTLYGEIYGPKIQKLTYNREEIDVVFFDLQIDGKYVDFEVFNQFTFDRNLPRVPYLYCGPFSLEILKEHTDGLTILGDCKHIREGCVVKPLKEVFDNKCGRKILKSVSAQYLLTKDEDNAEFEH